MECKLKAGTKVSIVLSLREDIEGIKNVLFSFRVAV